MRTSLVNVAVEQELIVAAISVALFVFTRFWYTSAQVQSSRVETLLWDRGSPNNGPRTKSCPRSHFILPQSHFANNEKIIFSRNICWLGRMWLIAKQSHYVRCPALQLLCNSLCGPLANSLETLASKTPTCEVGFLQNLPFARIWIRLWKASCCLDKNLLLTLFVAVEWFRIYCRTGWQLTSDESWQTLTQCTDRTLITWTDTIQFCFYK